MESLSTFVAGMSMAFALVSVIINYYINLQRDRER